MTGDPCDVEAEAIVAAAPDVVFEFLSRLENHWRIAGRFLEVLALDQGPGGTVRMRGPLGVRRTAHTTVTDARAPRLMVGVAELAGGTRARVSWTLTARSGKTLVRLAAQVERATALDRALLRLGGHTWLRRRFAETLGELAAACATAPTPAAATPVPQTTLGT